MPKNDGEPRDSLMIDVSDMSLLDINATKDRALMQSLERIRLGVEEDLDHFPWGSHI